METILFDSSTETLMRVLAEFPSGQLRVLCPQCRAEMLVALDWESANRLKVHPGIFCPVDWRHAFSMINLGSKAK